MSETRYTATDLAHWYAVGIQHERERIASADYEHTQAWARLGEQLSEARRQQLLRLFRTCAEDFHERMSSRPYREHRGGPVDWEPSFLARVRDHYGEAA